MATDTAPPVPAGPPDPPAAPAVGTAPAAAGDIGIMAALMAAVEPARPVSATGAGARPDGDDPAAKADPDAVVDRSSPGVTSESFKAPKDLTGAGSDAAGARHKEGVFKTLIRAGATRWAKGGGTANKRLDLERTRAGAHQVKESRTTTVMKSPGLPTRNGSGGAGGGGHNSGGNGGGNSGRGSTGNGSTGTGRGGSGGATGGGGRGLSGSSGSNGSGSSGGGHGTSGNGGGNPSKDTGSKAVKDPGSKGKDGSSGNAGSGGKAGKEGKPGAAGSGGETASGGSSGGNSGASKDKAGTGQGAKADLKKGGSGQGSGGSPGIGGGSGSRGSSGNGGGKGSGGSSGSAGGFGSSGGPGKNGKDGSGSGSGSGSDGADSRTPLQRSRETGHGDGSKVRDVVDHVKAYAKGAKDGYQDKKEENGKEHVRLDEAHAGHKAKQQDPKKDTPKGTAVTGPDGRTLVIAPPNKEDDGVSTDVKPLTVTEIDPNTLTLGTGASSGSISRKELRTFKQYERKLEAKENHLIKVADACKSLEAAAQDEAKDCQGLAEQAKAVEGGQKLAAKLTKLADASKAQAAEAAELHKRARRAAEMCTVVLTNIGTRYAPLYKAVVDSDETKPAELRFYNDKGSYAPAA